MKTVWKYPIPLMDSFTIVMPPGNVLHVAVQHEMPCLWALVDTQEPNEQRRFRLAGTGHPLPTEADFTTYIGTFQLEDLVFHLFEEVL